MSKWTNTDANLRDTLAIGAGWDPVRTQAFIDRVNALGAASPAEELDQHAP